MNIQNTINMCEQKCISERYSNRANLLKREFVAIKHRSKLFANVTDLVDTL